MPTARFIVSGLADDADARRLEAVLLSLEGVHGVVASLAEHCMEIDFEDDCVTVAEMIEAADNAGFGARLAG
jgi:copper chaperone CopZ